MRRMIPALAAALLAIGISAPAQAGSIAPADLECGETISESLTLPKSMFDCPASGILIGADGITIDLGGHTIDGTLAADSRAVDLQGHSRVTIRNGVLKDFVDGVRGGIFGIKVVGLRIFNIPSNAVLLGSDSTARGNFISEAGLAIGVPSADRTLLKGNTVDNTTNGISVSGAGSSENVIEGNRVTRVDFNPISVSGQNNVVRNNTVEANFTDGIQIGGNSNRAVGNTSQGNVGAGILLEGNTSLLRGNKARGNDGDGIFVDPGAIQNTLRENIANGNEDGGIDVDSTTVKLIDNVTKRNGFTDGAVNNVGGGIVAPDVPGIRGSGNISRDNDGPDCLPVRLC